MIHISFNLPDPESPWRKTWDDLKALDSAKVGEMDLRYKYCGVRLGFIVDGAEVVSPSRYVTLIDLALAFSFALRRMSSGEDAAFGFTESDEVIHLRQGDGCVHISSSEKTDTFSAGGDELADELRSFVRAAYSTLLEEVPGLSANPIIQRLRT